MGQSRLQRHEFLMNIHGIFAKGRRPHDPADPCFGPLFWVGSFFSSPVPFESVEIFGGLNQVQITSHKEMTFQNITASCEFWKLPFGTEMYFCVFG